MSSQFLQLKNQFAGAQGRPSIEYSTSSGSTSSASSTTSLSSSPRSKHSMDSSRSQAGASVEIMRCSRCAKTVELIMRRSSDGVSRVSASDASANGMVRFGHNLYYCDRCARLVGYK